MRARVMAVTAFVVGIPGLALAHLGLVSPGSRYGPDILKVGPCGMAGGQRTSDRVYAVKSGATITITWDEYINHPGHYRVSFDDDGDDDLREPTYTGPTGTIDAAGFTANEYPATLIDLIPDKQGGTYTQEVALPSIECDNCTLQVIQVMYDKPPYDCDTNPSCNDVYHQCVDLVLAADGPDTPTLLDAPDAGPGDPGADAGPGTAGEVTSGGCSTGGSPHGVVPMWLGLALTLALFRRRRATGIRGGGVPSARQCASVGATRDAQASPHTLRLVPGGFDRAGSRGVVRERGARRVSRRHRPRG